MGFGIKIKSQREIQAGFFVTFYISSFQNGILIHGTDNVDETIYGNDWLNIKSGAHVEFDRGFYLQDLSSPVEINIYGYVSRTNTELLETMLIPIPE